LWAVLLRLIGTVTQNVRITHNVRITNHQRISPFDDTPFKTSENIHRGFKVT
jgi:hypothetical protein